jgi:hypothetical protein
MPNIPARAIRILALAASPLLLAACGGGNADPAPIAARPGPVQPSPPPAPADPAPPPNPPAPPQAPAAPPPPEPVLAADYTNLVDGTIVSPPGWNDWVGPADRATVGGVACMVNQNFHQHSLVSIYKDGVRQGLPGNIGRGACDYELHTHDVTGVVHIETDVAKKFSLGQFFALWNQPLAANRVAGLGAPLRFYVIENEKLTRYTGDPAALQLVPHGEIVIVSGTAPAVLPKYRWPSDL